MTLGHTCHYLLTPGRDAYLRHSSNRIFWFGYDLCVALAILDMLNTSCRVKVCVCIADVCSSEEQFVWRLV